VSLHGCPAGESVPDLLREELLELRPDFFRARDDEPCALPGSNTPFDRLGHPAEVVGGELVDVPLEPGLRPAPLVVAARLLLAQVRVPLEPAGPEPVDAPPLTVHDRHERAVSAADERRQRRQVEIALDLDPVWNGFGELQRDPDVVETRAEEGEPVRAVALELLLEVALDPLEVALERLLLGVAQLAAGAVLVPVGQQRAHPGGGVARCR
jgi:hypothetical protein